LVLLLLVCSGCTPLPIPLHCHLLLGHHVLLLLLTRRALRCSRLNRLCVSASAEASTTSALLLVLDVIEQSEEEEEET
jgi:hypothetical protein